MCCGVPEPWRRASAQSYCARPVAAAYVDERGLQMSDDWHKGLQAKRMMPAETEPDRAVLVQSAGNIAALRALDLSLLHALDDEIGAGDFGENVWLEGLELHSGSVCVGDRFRVLRAGHPTGLELEVSSPRGPCSRVDARHGKTPGPGGVAAACARTGLGGWFCRVVAPGSLQEGDTLHLALRIRPDWTLLRVSAALHGDELAPGTPTDEREAALRALAQLPELARFEWRDDAISELDRTQVADMEPFRQAFVAIFIVVLVVLLGSLQ